jgi:hypothetical protein
MTRVHRAVVGGAVFVVVLVACALAWSDAVLSTDPRPMYGAWRLGWLREALGGAGLHTTQAGWPTGGRVAPHLEELLVAPLVGWTGPVATWNALQVLRLAASVLGAAALLRRHGLDPRFAVLLAPPVLDGTAAGMAWVPAALAVASGGGALRGALSGLLLSQGADVGLAGLLAGALAGVRGRATWAAWLAVSGGAWALEAWAAHDPLELALQGTWTLRASRVDRAQLSVAQLRGAIGGALAAGALAGLLGVWAARGTAARNERNDADLVPSGLAALGLGVALGPWVLLAPHQPLLVAGRPVPLPGALLSWVPPLAGAVSLAGWLLLVWLALAVWAAAPRLRGRRARLTLALGVVAWAASDVRLYAVLPRASAKDPVLDHPGVSEDGPPWDTPALLDAQRRGMRTASRPGLPPPVIAAHMAAEGWSLRALQERLRALGVRGFRADPQAREGHGAVLAWLLGPAAAVEGTDWPDVRFAAWSPSWSVPLPPRESPGTPPEADPAWVDPELGVFMDTTLAEVASVRVRLYRSRDATRWTAGPVIAHSLSSLGITVAGDGSLLVSATAFPNRAVQARVPHLHGSTVLGLTSRDGARWGLRRWMVDVPLLLVDPHLDHDPRTGALRLAAWVRTGALGVDPAAHGGERPVVTARAGEGPWMIADAPPFLAEGFADPAWMGERLAATRLVPGERPEVRIWHRAGGRWSIQATLPDLTVPSPWWDGTRWRVVAQDMRPAGAGGIVEVVEDAPGLWSPPRTLEGVPRDPRCESPVVTRWNEDYVLLCSERAAP